MLVLGINTATDACEAALVRDGEVLLSLSEPMTRGHDARLAPLVDEMLRMGHVEPRELDRVAVVVGPGSFTGVRVAVAFARALALAADAMAVGVTTLEALEPAPTGRALAIFPAKRRPPDITWWAQRLESGQGVAEPVEVGPDAVAVLAADVDALWGDAPPNDWLHHPARSTAAAAALFASRLPPGALPPARPIYVREPDAAPMRPNR